MTGDEVYLAWAPEGAAWSPWVKPVLFAHVDEIQDEVPTRLPKPSWLEDVSSAEQVPKPGDPHRIPAREHDTALIVDLEAHDALAAGIALLDEDFFPVPLFNALPDPVAVIDLDRTVALLAAAAEVRARAILADDAAPAFLLDARRNEGIMPVTHGKFDNRSVMFESDFPSGDRLLGSGIRTVVVVRAGSDRPAVDLRAMLAEWQRAGLEIRLKRTDRAGAAGRIVVREPGLLHRTAHWLRRKTLQLRADGAYGALIEQPPSVG